MCVLFYERNVNYRSPKNRKKIVREENMEKKYKIKTKIENLNLTLNLHPSNRKNT